MAVCPICNREYEPKGGDNNLESYFCKECFETIKIDINSCSIDELRIACENLDICCRNTNITENVRSTMQYIKQMYETKLNEGEQYKTPLERTLEDPVSEPPIKKTCNTISRKIYRLVSVVCAVIGFLFLIWGIQIWSRQVYWAGCRYLEEKVLTDAVDHDFVGFDKNNISVISKDELLDFGQGKMTYYHFWLKIPVTFHSKEYGEVTWDYEMEIFVHLIGRDGYFKKSRYVRCSGEPTWAENIRNVFDE